MKIHPLCGPPTPGLAQALAEFEAPFTYPLGPGRSFRITHGEDYTLFFRAQGNGACFVAEREGRVIGALGTVVRRLWMPDGMERVIGYIGDLKIAAPARNSTVLVRLARAAESWLRPQVEAAFGVVMGGTRQTPESYTNRAGIPGFREMGRLTVLRASSFRSGMPPDAKTFLTTAAAGLACYQRLSRGRYACPVGAAGLRSIIDPVWLMHPDGSACGLLEDTRQAKRLIVSDDSELLSAHLSCFAYETVPAAAQLIDCAGRRAAALGLPGLFVAVADADAGALRAALSNADVLAAPAIIYGTGLQAGAWNINSSEI